SPSARARATASRASRRSWSGRRSMSPPDRGAASRGGGATVLFVVWPEYGHVVTPLALAKQLAQSGYRVVFAGARTVAPALRALGYDYADLSLPGAPGEPTLFDFLPSRAA